MKRIANYLLTATALLGAAALLTFAAKNDFGLARNMETLVNMMRELSVYYVDEVDADRLMTDAAEGMVRRLDPYTVYMPEEEMTDFQFLTTGKYGGVGALIRKKGDGRGRRTALQGLPGRPRRIADRRPLRRDRGQGRPRHDHRTGERAAQRYAQHQRHDQGREAAHGPGRGGEAAPRADRHFGRGLRRLRGRQHRVYPAPRLYGGVL